VSDAPQQFYVRNRDNDCLDYMTDDRYLMRKIPEMRDQFAHIRSLQERYWDLRKITSNGAVVGGAGDMKSVALIPKDVFLAAEALEPDFVKDKSKFFAWLERNPQYKSNRGPR